MASEKTFEVDGVEFRFVNHAGGTEEIYVGEQLLSSFRSLMGGKHTFTHEGADFEVKVKVGITGIAFDVKKNDVKRDIPTDALPPIAMVACGWPLLLVAIGGAIGGGLGGAATGANVAIYKSSLPIPLKVTLNLASGAAAFGLWMLIGVLVFGGPR